ncbi:serine protease S53 [Heterobasidion irregulare TC 32-1]|uniref:Serine protease S53 n=1 Tax=Heterobasidion irregulare (strain TC 32-1) TaxID=747525 RepID=W4K0Y3_HETIT|nr:serine protease S53 [Heterobasidion irregulare TC 32-1]ETW78995.1 serine protease S53 [Heterobasidion irregulare TC 32-1]
MVRVIALVAPFIALACAKPHAQRAMRVHERRDSPPTGYANSGPAPATDTLDLRLALTQNNFQGLEDALYAVSTPGNPRYGQHLSKEEVEELVAPSSDTVSAINEWLSSNGLTSSKVSPSGDWIAVNTTVEKANELLDADFSTFTQLDSGTKAVRTLSYSIPASLKDHISFIHPTIAFPVKSTIPPVTKLALKTNLTASVRANADDVPASCETQVTPACLQAQYGIPSAPATQSSNTLAVSGFGGQFANLGDLQLFLQQFRPDLSSSTQFSVISVDNGQDSQDQAPGVEASLDIDYTVGVASGVPVIFVTVGDNTQDGIEGFLDQINALLSLDSPPQVLTTSFGFDEDQLPIDLATNLCNAYAQLGARGVSILFSSGDGGVSGGQDQDCTTFIPDDAVSAYLQSLGGTNAGLFNASSRAFPDVAGPAENVIIAFEGGFGAVAGTSCASPIFSSVVALINDQLIAAGKSPLGFLNPLIYQSPSAFNDITSGSNPGCNTNGFPTAPGWDPVTGFGSPNFNALKAAAGL